MRTILLVVVVALNAHVGLPAEPGVELGRASFASDPARPLDVLVRGFDSASLIEMDIFRGNEVVLSLVASFGSGGRGVCEAIYVDESSWFGWCSVYDFPFDNVTELANGKALANMGYSRKTYAVSASTSQCPAELIDDQKRLADINAIGRDMVLPALVEMSTWPDEVAADLQESLAVVGQHGCPILGRALLSFFQIDRSMSLNSDDLVHLDKVPDNLALALGHQRRRGLGDWLDEVVRDLP